MNWVFHIEVLWHRCDKLNVISCATQAARFWTHQAGHAAPDLLQPTHIKWELWIINRANNVRTMLKQAVLPSEGSLVTR